MNKRIQKKKLTQKRNASRKLILSMDEGIDKDHALMLHVIRFNDPGFFHEVIGPGPHYLVMPRMNGKRLFCNLMLEYLNKKEQKHDLSICDGTTEN